MSNTDFIINESKCIGCGSCVEDCPLGLLELNEKDKHVDFVKYAKKICINCGHCVAICPKSAVSIPNMDSAYCEKISDEWHISQEKVATFLKGRRSIRIYKDKEIEKSKIQELIDVAKYAPTGSNAQLVQWMVFSGKEEIKKLVQFAIDFMKKSEQEIDNSKRIFFNKVIKTWELGHDLILRNAPHLVLVHGPITEMEAIRRIDGIIALDYFELIAASAGFGTCWAGFFYFAISAKYPPLMEYLALPDGNVCYGATMLGIPKYKYKSIPIRNDAKIIWRDVEK